MPHQQRTASPTQRKRLPPFGRELMAMREQGLVPANGMCVVSLDSWDYGRAYARCVVTPDLHPGELNFAFVAAIDVVLVHVPTLTTIARRDAFIRELLKCRPTTLRVCAVADVMTWTWIKSRRVGVELEEFK